MYSYVLGQQDGSPTLNRTIEIMRVFDIPQIAAKVCVASCIVHTIALVAILTFATARAGAAQDSDQIKSRYTKTEHQIAMRDGKRLFTVVYAPRDTTRRYPIMLTRTPYLPSSAAALFINAASPPFAAL